MLNGSEIDSNLRFGGTGFQKNTIHGRMLMILIPTKGPKSWMKAVRTSTWKWISIDDILTLPNGPILLLLANNQPDDKERAVSP
jgi:hypothetical protein